MRFILFLALETLARVGFNAPELLHSILEDSDLEDVQDEDDGYTTGEDFDPAQMIMSGSEWQRVVEQSIFDALGVHLEANNVISLEAFQEHEATYVQSDSIACAYAGLDILVQNSYSGCPPVQFQGNTVRLFTANIRSCTNLWAYLTFMATVQAIPFNNVNILAESMGRIGITNHRTWTHQVLGSPV